MLTCPLPPSAPRGRYRSEFEYIDQVEHPPSSLPRSPQIFPDLPRSSQISPPYPRLLPAPTFSHLLPPSPTFSHLLPPSTVPQVESLLSAQPTVACLWVGAGVFPRGLWSGFPAVVEALLEKHHNLHISITPMIVTGSLSGLSRADALSIASKFPTQCCLGTTVREP